MNVAVLERERRVYVFVAACTGSAKLSGRIGLPLAHVGVAVDVAAAIRRLDELRYGSGFHVPGASRPVVFDPHWNDWALFPFELGPWLAASVPRPEGVRAVEHRIEVRLPGGVTIQAFRGELRAALRHLRLHEVMTATAYLAARGGPPRDLTVQPRYTAGPGTDGVRGLCRADDLYVLDPAERPWWLFWAVMAARLAVVEGVP